jgi:NAD(P)-dependent dehydrogenase (short-subunit alcohol dehydrogenase family)
MIAFRSWRSWTLLSIIASSCTRDVASFSIISGASRNVLRPRFISRTTPIHSPLAMSSSVVSDQDQRYSMADQEARFNKAKAENNRRFLDIESVYDPSYLKGKRVAITGANRGLGLALATEVTNAGADLIAIVRSSSPELDALQPQQIVTGVDATKDATTVDLPNKITGGPIDILINNAGYFKTEVEKLDSLDFADEIKTIDICAVGPLRITSSLINGGLLKEGSKVIMITSQGGSVSWRPTQCPEGGDYGHHVRSMLSQRDMSISKYFSHLAHSPLFCLQMSKAAANMMAMLLAQEVKSKGIAVGIFHPGFNKTGMTAKYKEIWDREGAVDPSIGAKRVMHETGLLSMDTTGKFINCEDGLEIPF